MTSIPRRPLLALSAVLLAFPALQTSAQTYPAKPITFVVPFAAGSATDQLARALGQGIATDTKQSVVVDTKPGAFGFIAAQQAAKAAPDGYTVLITTNTTHAANEHLYKKLPYDPVKDFAPVTALGKGGQIMVVNPSLPVKTVSEFIALAKKEPGKLSFGSGSSSSRIAGELLMQMADIKLLHIPYKSNPLAVTDLLGGQINMMITDNATGLPQVNSGKLRALGYSGAKRTPLAPDVPTIGETVKGYEMGYWFAAYVPAGTPAPVVAELNKLLAHATKSPGAASFYQSTGTEIYTTTPAELGAFQQAESQKWGRIIKAAGITPE
ncbi:Bug family tripartite tricarboxylate transporter substrate binding protein [Rhodoferax ferrireducens]|uniref:Bug family tripartite tricarboxylate transporter substrate binding protein n=1 Tax=Rhodoferax ferrireducens TaxID=192843 RepID=UPI000E0D7D35|nr:tripartite tricarboxylate transporter substrate binding protein [Rhodoferax ferrireducens]